MTSPVQFLEFEKGRTFVTGLFWQPFQSASNSERKKEIKNIATDLSYDLMVMRTSGVYQVAYGSSKDGLKPGMMSLAAVISKTLEMEGYGRSFQAAIPVSDDTWVYVAQYEGVIRKDFSGTESEVRKFFLDEYSLAAWDIRYAPAHWTITDAEERDFEDFLPKTKKGKINYRKWWELKPVTRTIRNVSLKKPLLVISLVSSLYYGWTYWTDYQAKQAQLAAAQQNAAVQAAKNVPAPHPWKNIPRALPVTMACHKAFLGLEMLFPAGWQPKDIVCSNGSLTVEWQRGSDSTIDKLLSVLPTATVYQDGDTASLSRSFDLPPGEDEEIPEEQARKIELLTKAQALNIKLELAAPKPPALLPGEDPQDPDKQYIKEWQEVMWRITDLGLSPDTAITALDGGGFRVGMIRTEIKNGLFSWSMEGIQYVKK